MIVELLAIATLVAFFLACLGVALFLKRRSAQTRCPECGTPCPTLRVPLNPRQAMWGGWTCSCCGAELTGGAQVLRQGRADAALLAGSLDVARPSRDSGDLTQVEVAGGLRLHHEEVVLDFEEHEAMEERDAVVPVRQTNRMK